MTTYLKRALSLTLAALILCGALAACDNPPSDSNEDFEYSYDAERQGVTIKKYTGSSLIVNVPEKMGGEPVTSIGKEAFKNSGMKEIYLPTSLTEIGDGAFKGCTELTSITIPDGVTRIGIVAFGGCTGLTSVAIPDSVTKIGKRAFEGCAIYTKDARHL